MNTKAENLSFSLSRVLAAILLIVLAGACASAPPAAEVKVRLSPRVDALVDPTLGWTGPDDGMSRETSAAWAEFSKGYVQRAEQVWQGQSKGTTPYPPALLGLAGSAIERAEYDRARSLIDQAESAGSWLAAEIYRAQLARLMGDLDTAATILNRVVLDPQAPAGTRDLTQSVKAEYVADLTARARATGDPLKRLALLERASEIGTLGDEDRLMLIRAYLDQNQPVRARAALQPLMSSAAANRNETQAVIADLEAAEGNFTGAMKRLERLVEVTGDPHYRDRLEAVKQAWHESTLPPRFHQAISSPALTREQLAVLMFWKVPAIRFAQRVSQPPIAVDLEGVRGREELVRALALGLLAVDSTSRRARPSELVPVSRFIEALAATLRQTGVRCSRAPMMNAMSVVNDCGLDIGALGTDPAGFVEGQTAAKIFSQVASLSSGE